MAIYETLLDCIRANRDPQAALARAVARLRADGFAPCEPACYVREDGSVYASSIASTPGTFGSPTHAVEIDAEGRMWIRNRLVTSDPEIAKQPAFNLLER